jgi:hypothetical protein
MCAELRANTLSDFHNFEKLRLLKHNSENPKTSHLLKQSDLDPITKARYENVKKMYAYVNRELPNVKSFLETQTRKKQE